MREIKFRAWDGKSMHYNVGLHFNGRGTTLQGIVSETKSEMIARGGIEKNIIAKRKLLSVNPNHDKQTAKVMQYTGLKDKNGVEIYEGDILRANTAQGAMAWDVDRSGWATFAPLDRFEVIGNIYENPKLLELAA